ncbi:hypothetical protein [Streptomyces sp. NPDC001135]
MGGNPLEIEPTGPHGAAMPSGSDDLSTRAQSPAMLTDEIVVPATTAED